MEGAIPGAVIGMVNAPSLDLHWQLRGRQPPTALAGAFPGATQPFHPLR